MPSFLVFLWNRLRGRRPAPPGCRLVARPDGARAYVIRLPGVFVGYGGTKERGSFQTVVLAPSEDMAWDIAVMCDVWERLPFEVNNVQIFPKDPLPLS